LDAALTDMPLEREKSRDVLRFAVIVVNERNFRFARVVTRDESWLYVNYIHTHIRSVSKDERPVGVNQTIVSEKSEGV